MKKLTIVFYFIIISLSNLCLAEDSTDEHLIWQEDRLITRVIQDKEGKAIKCYSNYYNAAGKLIEKKMVGNLSGNCPIPCEIGEDGYPVSNGCESYGIKYFYSKDNPELIASTLESNGVRTDFLYDQKTNCRAFFREIEQKRFFRCFYDYDDKDRLESTIFDDGSTDSIDDQAGVNYRQIIRFHNGDSFPIDGKPLKIENDFFDLTNNENDKHWEVQFEYDQNGELISSVNSSGESFERIENPLNDFMYADAISLKDVWADISNLIFSSFDFIYHASYDARKKISEELKVPSPFKDTIENLAKEFLGAHTYLFMGFQDELCHLGTYGEKNISDKVRVTFINGILNTKQLLDETLAQFSESHNNVKIHYVFRATKGWTADIIQAKLIKTCFDFGFRSSHAHMLADLWKELIEEMGGVNGGGLIIHYAHSLGGSDTDRARTLLSPEEQKMIRVVTIGSSTMIRNEGFQNVINLVSISDGISTLVDPFGHTRNIFDPNTNVRFFGTLFTNFSWPVKDHMLNGKTYSQIIIDLGKEFFEEFGERSLLP